ncbi:phosphate signaling complex protein PhoU [Phycisphaera mikurensis]|uniref:Phosphate-specific transport system accessory protein PhoU n=1 Tax=Phycisphaera mikurensis (strain NBRC 102666 / KCTC 22515 / FYK2301M01) TaxID=1142394 RepID=I0IHZ8_PHYMF|nr:phosphate signaling complex protein PhoU [Phycisphaera mikurensis]MBB6442550.1 phosphate transport system protein [Phycisphaera mikurensis]BAM04886.1 phosphate transport system regulatory protein [Phycisphaera mikurensis NBRC 102666]
MSVFLQKQIDKLKKQVLEIGACCEEALRDAVVSVLERDPDLAERVIARDTRIDLLEVELEEECLHTLALHQPVAFDLRYVVAVLKINNDLERIGDHAKSIAQQAIFLCDEPAIDRPPFDLREMSGVTAKMLRSALDALVGLDVDEAKAVRKLDKTVDRINAAMYDDVIAAMRKSPEHMEQLVHFMNISRQLERTADHACNVAKDVRYMAEGEIFRHMRKRRQAAEQAEAIAAAEADPAED